jgi:hypothetical protein
LCSAAEIARGAPAISLASHSAKNVKERIAMMVWWYVAIVGGWLASGALIPVLWKLSSGEQTSKEVMQGETKLTTARQPAQPTRP